MTDSMSSTNSRSGVSTVFLVESMVTYRTLRRDNRDYIAEREVNEASHSSCPAGWYVYIYVVNLATNSVKNMTSSTYTAEWLRNLHSSFAMERQLLLPSYGRDKSGRTQWECEIDSEYDSGEYAGRRDMGVAHLCVYF